MNKLLEISSKTTNEYSYYFAEELLKQNKILIAFTSRIGGVSKQPFKGLNLGLQVGDDPDRVIANRRIVAEAMNIDLNRMTCAEQVHGSAVAMIDEEAVGRGALSFSNSIKGVDALVTASVNIPMVLFFADCVPVVMADPLQRVVAVVHAGWRGIYGRIIENTVKMMVETGGASVENIIAIIGPAIGGCCYEVGEDLSKRFRKQFENEDLWLKNGSRIDLKMLARIQLNECGVKDEKSNVHNYCTACNSDVLYSYRANKGSTGRHAAVVNMFCDDNKQRNL